MLDPEINVNMVDIRNFSSVDWRHGHRALQARVTGAGYLNHGEVRSTQYLVGP